LYGHDVDADIITAHIKTINNQNRTLCIETKTAANNYFKIKHK